MKRILLLVLVCVAVCLAAYCAIYYAGTSGHRSLLNTDTPELAWLQKEFSLSEAELKRISKLHAAYQPHCKEMCRRIDEQNRRLQQLLAGTNTVTPEIEGALTDAAKLRAECQRDMLQHFYEVARTMPPEQAKRYLAWVQERTLLPAHGVDGIH